MTSHLNENFREPRVFAHRGASEEYPQNTIMAFDEAVQQGAAGIETDLRYTKDHEIICFHDQNLDRLSTIRGSISNTTMREIARAKVRHKVHSQAIPTLADLLMWLPKETSVILELKDHKFGEPALLDSFIGMLARYNVIEKTILSSFSMTNLKRVKRVLPSMVTCFITPYNLSPNINTDCVAPYYPILWLNPTYSDTAHRLHKQVSVWDSHPENRIEYYLQQEVDILTSDNPAKLLKAVSMVKPRQSVSP